MRFIWQTRREGREGNKSRGARKGGGRGAVEDIIPLPSYLLHPNPAANTIVLGGKGEGGYARDWGRVYTI